MSDAPTSGAIADVLLVIDTVTLLENSPEATKATDAAHQPVSVDGAQCYGLAPNREALTAACAAQWSIDVSPGDRLRLRWTPLAMRAEHAVLLQLSLADDAVLSGLRLKVDEHATRYAPQSGTPEAAVAREAPDAYWQADVAASGTVKIHVDALVTDRDAAVLARFRWAMQIIVP